MYDQKTDIINVIKHNFIYLYLDVVAFTLLLILMDIRNSFLMPYTYGPSPGLGGAKSFVEPGFEMILIISFL